MLKARNCINDGHSKSIAAFCVKLKVSTMQPWKFEESIQWILDYAFQSRFFISLFGIHFSCRCQHRFTIMIICMEIVQALRVLPSFFFDWFANESMPKSFMPALTSSKSLSVVWNASDTNSLSTALFDCAFTFEDVAQLSWVLFANLVQIECKAFRPIVIWNENQIKNRSAKHKTENAQRNKLIDKK